MGRACMRRVAKFSFLSGFGKKTEIYRVLQYSEPLSLQIFLRYAIMLGERILYRGRYEKNVDGYAHAYDLFSRR